MIEVNLKISRILLDIVKYDDCTDILDRSLKICQDNFAKDDPILSKVYNSLSQLNRFKSKYEISHEYCLKALEINSKSLDPTDIEMGKTYYHLGSSLYNLDQYDDSKKWITKALEIVEAYTGEDRDLELGLIHQRLGHVYEIFGNYHTASQHFEKSINFFKVYYQGDHPDINAVINNLASLYFHCRHIEKAQSYYQALLDSSLKIHGEYHKHPARAYQGLGNVYNALSDFKAAEKNLLKALEIFKVIFGENDIDVASTYVILGEVMFQQKKFVDMLKYHFIALRIHEKTVGDRDSYVQRPLTNLQKYMTHLNPLEDALKPGLKVLRLRKKFYGTKHHYYTNQERTIHIIQCNIDLYHVGQYL